MTREEFSNGFDTLVSSYRRFKDFDNQELLDSIEFDEYEKSLYLTKAQEELVIGLYSGKNQFGDSFESTEEIRRYLSSLVAEAVLMPVENSTGVVGMGSSSKFFTLPEDLWFITYESVVVTGETCDHGQLDVYPVRQDEYHKIKRNPFRGANDRRVLRLDLADGVIEIISKYPASKYYVRYLRKVKPIVLVDLPNGLTVGGESEATDCELHESLHQRILEMAVVMALQSKGVGMSSQTRKEEK